MLRAVVVVCLFGGAAAAGVDRAVVETAVPIRSDWTARGPADPSSRLTLTIAVTQNNLDRLEEALHEVSTPGSPARGQYWGHDEVHELTSNPHGSSAVLAWLEAAGVQVVATHCHGSYITARANASVWSGALEAELSELVHGASDVIIRATTHMSAPASVAPHVAGIHPLAQLPMPDSMGPADKASGRRSSRLSAASGLDDAAQHYPAIIPSMVTPALIRQYYGVGNASTAGAPLQAVYESLSQGFSQADLRRFLDRFGLPVGELTFSVDGKQLDAETVATIPSLDASDAKCLGVRSNCPAATNPCPWSQACPPHIHAHGHSALATTRSTLSKTSLSLHSQRPSHSFALPLQRTVTKDRAPRSPRRRPPPCRVRDPRWAI